jgi:Holliday junction resolvasome RuvABC endonuclease subunit
MRILALDLGTHCGWALLDGECVTSGVWDMTPKRGKDHPGKRYSQFEMHLNRIGDVDTVYYEEVRNHRNPNGYNTTAAHVYGGYKAVLLSWAEKRGLLCVGIEVKHIKLCAAGKGNASKSEMVEAAKRLFPEQSVASEDQADALCVLHSRFRLGDGLGE